MGGDENHPDVKYGCMAAQKYNTEHHEFIPSKDEIHETLLDFKKIGQPTILKKQLSEVF